MTDLTYYLWAPIKGSRTLRGAVVTPASLSKDCRFEITDEMFWEMIEAGSIRSKPCPAPPDYLGSPRQYLLDRLEATAGDDMSRMAAVLAIAEDEADMAKPPVALPADVVPADQLKPTVEAVKPEDASSAMTPPEVPQTS